MYLSDDRRRHVHHLEPPLDEVPAPEAVARGNRARERIVGLRCEVVSGAERRACAPDHGDVHVVVLIGAPQLVEQHASNRVAQRVALGGAVEREPANARPRVVGQHQGFGHDEKLKRIAEACLQPLHPRDPPVVIGRLTPEVLQHLRVREDQERLGREPAYDRVGDGVGLEHAVDAGHAAVGNAGGHGGAHGLGCEHRDLDALIAVGDREPFRERQRRMLGRR